MTDVVLAEVTGDPIDLPSHEAAVARAEAGAVVGFIGAVRDHDGGRGVTRLEYSAHPTAARVLAEVVEREAVAAEGVRAVAVSHRVGPLAIGDAALVVAVSADHRAAAFATCARLVDAVKEALPVWKHQMFADGTDEWVGCA
ncbi:Molybdopterin biosynthesis MoaE protein OS=Tsukamurella paurometabola (strain ATCC 8368 / DSM/ CCUG 35730 / CIP 100753 / JCM 10117 / KCTC 9821 / NBRC 16120/ NCIMB 702349 / NCTC 13040) OX=521096 GN=Tpau_0819 PE=4 SV=1 [Tsukamurella paurometabola]|uniref:Molybdopterin biosynthesis MoaE protein n=1 Tax=Tsukamurella paurometabola (strain ATCC 8368 / DSM 20162 / CCUG 35730 / CIP 100753 / JCM 10117 / KCTC 9821 / NBRC 16120 / NCIMB 702349 / NCTC 13040) TaxID=521096 RepID=D5UTV1_TSUPD|nr:molybdenum cofactor biosynthesis protein MoaE [Tsukamurella paurometabola]ADG77455.1 molybdopterin biosynthesis MoaE protein [Tsukamurella paurometabola DSM 20162]SUP27116.1 Molybdopterin synthase catalytic subunit 1 [Tsukamurella paurometabola]